MAISISGRRTFLKKATQSVMTLPFLSALEVSGTAQSSVARSGSTAATASRPKLILNVRDFGAKGDGTTKETGAIQQALDRCWVLGGGEVLVPAGNYLTGSIALRPDTLLRLERDAVLLGSPDFADYPVAQVRWEGKWIQGHLGLIYALGADRTGIIGPGKIVGNPALGGRPTAENPLRHPALIEPIGCNDLRFQDFSTSYSRMWSLHPTYCENIVIENLTIRSTGGNGDGIDIDSCKHVRIDACDIATGDDCISLKSGRGNEGYTLRKTTEDVHITNCTFADSIFACIGIGSETSGGIRNVRIEHCKFTHANTYAFYIKSHTGRGAFIEDIVAEDLDIDGAKDGFLRLNITGSGIQDQFPVPGNEGIPTIKNFKFSNIRVKDCPILVEGTAIHPDKPLEGFSLTDVHGNAGKGIYLANVKKAELRNIQITGYAGPLINIYNVTGNGLKGASILEAPKIPETIPESTQTYQLR
jgi:polygalacturonase